VNTGISKPMMFSTQGNDGCKASFSSISSDMVHFDWRIINFSYAVALAQNTAQSRQLSIIVLFSFCHPKKLLLGTNISENALARASTWSSLLPLGNNLISLVRAIFHSPRKIITLPMFT